MEVFAACKIDSASLVSPPTIAVARALTAVNSNQQTWSRNQPSMSGKRLSSSVDRSPMQTTSAAKTALSCKTARINTRMKRKAHHENSLEQSCTALESGTSTTHGIAWQMCSDPYQAAWGLIVSITEKRDRSGHKYLVQKSYGLNDHVVHAIDIELDLGTREGMPKTQLSLNHHIWLAD